jgi:hypothetical protein
MKYLVQFGQFARGRIIEASNFFDAASEILRTESLNARDREFGLTVYELERPENYSISGNLKAVRKK